MKETVTKSRYFLDSSAWVAYFYAESAKVHEILESDGVVLTSVLTLYEVKKRLLAGKLTEKMTETLVDFMLQRSFIVDVSEGIALDAATLSFKRKIPMADAIIYSSAKSANSILVTADSDFSGLPNVVMV